MELIVELSNLQCSDSRDSVYAILSLVEGKQSERNRIIPNYAKSPADVFFDIFLGIDDQWSLEGGLRQQSVRQALDCTYEDLILASRFRLLAREQPQLNNYLSTLIPKLVQGMVEWATRSKNSSARITLNAEGRALNMVRVTTLDFFLVQIARGKFPFEYRGIDMAEYDEITIFREESFTRDIIFSSAKCPQDLDHAVLGRRLA